MEYKEFVENLVTEIRKRTGNTCKVEIQEIRKNNGNMRKGISVSFGKSNVVPVLYPEEAYEAYQEGMGIEECARIVLRVLEEKQEINKEVQEIVESSFYWEQAKEMIYPLLLSVKENQEILKQLVWTKLLDLAVIHHIRKDGSDQTKATVKITRDMMRLWGVTEAELYKQAVENQKKDMYWVRKMDEVILHYGMDEKVKGVNKVEAGEMYILSNRENYYGAAGLLSSELLCGVAAGQNLFILPSSIHELILLQDDGTYNPEELENMVQEVNWSCVSREERLSDHLYYYDGQNRKLEVYTKESF